MGVVDAGPLDLDLSLPLVRLPAQPVYHRPRPRAGSSPAGPEGCTRDMRKRPRKGREITTTPMQYRYTV